MTVQTTTTTTTTTPQKSVFIGNSKTFSFLKNFKVTDKREFNLTNMESPYGKYNMPNTQASLKELACCIASDNKSGFYPALVEQHVSNDPIGRENVYFDFDIELTKKISRQEWTDLVSKIVYQAQDTVAKTFETIDNANVYVLYRDNIVYEKVGDNSEVVYKYGLHLVYPNVAVSRRSRKLLYGQMIRNFEADNVFAALPLVSSGVGGGGKQSLTKILDESVVDRSGIMVFGCTKKGKTPYSLQQIYDNKMQSLPFDKTAETYQSDMILRLMCCLPDMGATGGDGGGGVGGGAGGNGGNGGGGAKAEPKLLLNDNQTADLVKAFNISDKVAQTIEPSVNTGKRNILDHDRTMLVAQAQKLLAMLTTDTYGKGSYERWKSMVISCANVGGDLLRSECHRISRKSPSNYNRHELDNFYSNVMGKNYPNWIQSLQRLAKEDNPDMYGAYIEERRKASIEDSEEASTYKLAKAVKELVGEYFVSTDSQTTWAIWYFNKTKHKWTNKRGYDELSIYISEDFCKIYEDRVESLEQSLENDSTDKERILYRITHIKKNIIGKLRNITFKTLLIKEIGVLISDENFEDSLDSNAHLVGFNNGVFDLDKQVFRPGLPCDMISLGTNIDYMPYNPNDPMTAKFMKVLEDIHPKKENREYWLKTMACALHGRRQQQRLYFWIGSGSNGKSTLIDLTQKAFGDLMDTPHVSLLTKPIQNNGGPNPMIVGLKGKRLVIFLEPEHTDRISSSFMKQLFGGDTLTARTLHSKNYVRYRSQMMGIVSCNDLPQVPSNDFGTWRRIRTVPHPTEFTSHPVKPHQRAIDTSVDDDLGNMAEPFMSVLMEYYTRYIYSSSPSQKFKIFIEPEDVTNGTKEYQTDCDFYADFVSDTLKETGSDADVLDSKDLYVDFQDWYQQTNPGKKPAEWKQFKKNVGKKLGMAPNTTKWKGWKKQSYIDLVDTPPPPPNASSGSTNNNSNNSNNSIGPSF